jgi:hypothetical protein
VAIVVLFFSLVNLAHLLRYGENDAAGLLVTFVYLAGVFIVVFIANSAMPEIAWTEPIVFENLPKLF